MPRTTKYVPTNHDSGDKTTIENNVDNDAHNLKAIHTNPMLDKPLWTPTLDGYGDVSKSITMSDFFHTVQRFIKQLS